MADDFNRSKETVISLQLEYPQNYLEKTQELHLFRILQELINNSIRHGKAKNINFVIKKRATTLHVVYSDNGIGFDLEQSNVKKGLGMTNIESRVDFLNGTLKTASTLSKGSTFIITI